MTDMIHDYLDQVWTELPLSMGRGQRRRIVCEIEDHLLESWDADERGRYRQKRPCVVPWTVLVLQQQLCGSLQNSMLSAEDRRCGSSFSGV